MVSGILQRFARIALEQPARPAIFVSGSDQLLSASAVWKAHLELREQLLALGVEPDRLILSAAGNHSAAVPLLLACLSLRAPLLAVDASATASEIEEFGTRFGASVVVVPETAQRNAQPGVSLSGDLCTIPRCSNPSTYPGAALLKLTSGSTGLPKAILTSEAHLIADGERIIGSMGIGPDDIQLAAIPLSHSYGFGNLLMPLLLQGTPMVLQDSFVPKQLLVDARAFQARIFPGVPYMFTYFAANPPTEGWPDCLQLLISAGARLDARVSHAFHEQFGIKIHSFYGASEAGGIAYDASDTATQLGCVGKPMPGVTIMMRPDEEAPAGSGRIFLRSTSVASGYVSPDDEEESPFQEGGYLTGDFGYLEASGELRLTGRASPAVNVAGRKVHPAEVERVLRTMEGIDDVCVLAAPDARRGQQILACIISRRPPSTLDVRRFCAARLAPHKVPRAIVFLPSLPTTGRGKTDQARLLALALEQLGRDIR